MYSAVGTTWDKDFRSCLVLSSLKMDLIYDKNSEFHIPEEQVSPKSCRLSETHPDISESIKRNEKFMNERIH